MERAPQFVNPPAAFLKNVLSQNDCGVLELSSAKLFKVNLVAFELIEVVELQFDEFEGFNILIASTISWVSQIVFAFDLEKIDLFTKLILVTI